jgi:hypothetical protein
VKRLGLNLFGMASKSDFEEIGRLVSSLYKSRKLKIPTFSKMSVIQLLSRSNFSSFSFLDLLGVFFVGVVRGGVVDEGGGLLLFICLISGMVIF